MKSKLAGALKDRQERQQQRHAADHRVHEKLGGRRGAQRPAPKPNKKERRNQAQLPEDEPVEEIQRRESAKQSRFKKKNQCEVERGPLLDMPRCTDRHRHDDRGEQQHQQPQAVDANVIFAPQSRESRHVALQIEAHRIQHRIDATAPTSTPAQQGLYPMPAHAQACCSGRLRQELRTHRSAVPRSAW